MIYKNKKIIRERKNGVCYTPEEHQEILKNLKDMQANEPLNKKQKKRNSLPEITPRGMLKDLQFNKTLNKKQEKRNSLPEIRDIKEESKLENLENQMCH